MDQRTLTATPSCSDGSNMSTRAVAAVYMYPERTAITTCISHSGMALYENCVAGQRNLDVYSDWV